MANKEKSAEIRKNFTFGTVLIEWKDVNEFIKHSKTKTGLNQPDSNYIKWIVVATYICLDIKHLHYICYCIIWMFAHICDMYSHI